MTERHRTPSPSHGQEREQAQQARPRPTSKAVAHWARTGTIIPGHEAEVAAYISEVQGRE